MDTLDNKGSKEASAEWALLYYGGDLRKANSFNNQNTP